MGLQISAAISGSGQVAAAYWDTTGTAAGQCAYNPPVDKTEWKIHYATLQANGDWKVETVVDAPVVGQPRGLSLKFGSDGVPRIAATGGPVSTPGPVSYCGSNDAYLYTRGASGTWTGEAAATNSTDAIPNPPASPAYDVGFVVGDWSALAFDASDEPAIAYRDTHFGGEQSIDNKRSDLELAWKKSGAWKDLPVDMGRGAGLFMNMVFDTKDRPVLAYQVQYHTPTGPPAGLFAVRSADGGKTFESVQLSTVLEEADPALAVRPSDGTLFAAWYDATVGLPVVAELTDPTQFTDISKGWTLTRIGDKRYDEGYHPSIAFAPDGRVAVAYYRCTLATNGLGNCNTNDDALVFAWDDGTTWHREVVDSGGSGNCGMSPSLVFEPDGHAIIVYECSVKTGPTSYEYQVFAATREPLP